MFPYKERTEHSILSVWWDESDHALGVDARTYDDEGFCSLDLGITKTERLADQNDLIQSGATAEDRKRASRRSARMEIQNSNAAARLCQMSPRERAPRELVMLKLNSS